MKQIWLLVVSGTLLFSSCQLNNNVAQVKPEPFDSNSIVAPGIVEKIVINQDGYFIDTGAYIIVKGKGFDPKFRNDYFLEVRHSDTKYTNNDTIVSSRVINSKLYDKNLLAINDTTNTFKLEKHILIGTTYDSSYVYFLKLKRGTGRQDRDYPKEIDFTGYLQSKLALPMLPVYKLLKDTLLISKQFNGKDKEMILFSHYSDYFKIMIHGLEYPQKNGYFSHKEDFTAPAYYKTTISMVATQDLFLLPDGWHDFEIYQRGGNQRRCVEESGKKRIYIKNVP